ncbi:hypothetical protein, partial [Pseudomonas sp. VI4.1]|uniref:hypothetical protein n=1 Tax=Pseudomonas sp. VI4.1 TaxID=1941346 RepID=UPI001C437BEE
AKAVYRPIHISADTPLSLASQLLQGLCGRHKQPEHLQDDYIRYIDSSGTRPTRPVPTVEQQKQSL